MALEQDSPLLAALLSKEQMLGRVTTANDGFELRGSGYRVRPALDVAGTQARQQVDINAQPVSIPP